MPPPSGAPTTTRTTLARPAVSRVPAPIPTAATAIGGSAPQSSARARRRAMPVGVAQLALAAREDLPAPGELEDRGRRHRQVAVRRADASGPHRHRARRDAADAEVGERRAHADDVRDRVPRPHLVECDVVGRDAVHAALGVGEPGEDRERRLLDHHGQVRRLQQRPDPRPRAMRVILAEALHVDLERAQPGPRHRARPHGDLARHDGADRGPDRVEGGTGVEQRAEQHVAGDARRRVDPQVRSSAGGHARTLRRCHAAGTGARRRRTRGPRTVVHRYATRCSNSPAGWGTCT